ncbi:MAG TPA: hypothetical protein VF950_06795 [Planctomycetota bacterium]
MTTLLLAAILAAFPPDDERPAAPRQEEAAPKPGAQAEPAPAPTLRDDVGGGLLDFDWLELHARLGIAMFGDDFRIDPAFQVTLLAHAPMPWLSPASDPGGDYFGVFLGATLIPGVERDLDPAPSGADGSIFLFQMGVDYTFFRNQSVYLTVEAGGQYAFYGGIEGLSDGLGAVAGVNGGVHIGSGLTLGLALETAFVDNGDRIDLFSLDLVIEF